MGSEIALLKLYCGKGRWREVFSLYNHLRRAHGLRPDSFTLPILLNSATSHLLGQSIHADALKRGFNSDSYVGNALVSVYARTGLLRHARNVFDEIPDPGVVSWNAAISSFFRAGDCGGAGELFEKMAERNVVTWAAMAAGYTQNGCPREALFVFRRMRWEAVEADEAVPNSNTVASVLSACVQLRDLSCGMQVHGYIVKVSEYAGHDVFVGSALVDLYGKCGCVVLARRAFDSMVEKCVVAWSTLISVNINNECPNGAVEVFREMIYDGVGPNYFTLTMLLNACGLIINLRLGKELHCYILRRIGLPDLYVSTALIDMYSKCSLVEYARRTFQKDKAFNGNNGTAMWNSMIAGYLANDHVDEAWCVIRSLTQLIDCKPNGVTMAIILPLFTKSASLLYGKEVHAYAIKNGLDKLILVGNSLVDMYSKCGKIQWAKAQFDRMEERNGISWTTMINGYGSHGDGEGAIRIFETMVERRDIKPDSVTFVALISACSHAGLVEEGLKYFRSMERGYDLLPTEEIYSSVIDLLARAGHISEAKKFIASMPLKPGRTIWGALLGSCRTHGDIDDAEIAADHLAELEPNESGFRTLLSNMYAENGRMEGSANVRKEMHVMGVVKRQGCSWLEGKTWALRFYCGKSSNVFDRSKTGLRFM